MKELKGACIIGQSGGPTAVINASVLGAVQTALNSPQITRVLGAAHGITGVLNEQLYDMGMEDPAELELLKFTPSSALGTCRYKMKDPDVDPTDYEKILETFIFSLSQSILNRWVSVGRQFFDSAIGSFCGFYSSTCHSSSDSRLVDAFL